MELVNRKGAGYEQKLGKGDVGNFNGGDWRVYRGMGYKGRGRTSLREEKGWDGRRKAVKNEEDRDTSRIRLGNK